MGSLIAALLATVTMVSSPPVPGCDPACSIRPNTVYVSPVFFADPAWKPLRARTLNHELGHIFDYNYMDDGARNRFQSIMRDGRAWGSATNSPHEQFAEAFTFCARSVKFPPSAAGGYDYHPTVRQHRAVCRLILSVAARSGLPTSTHPQP